MCMCIYNIYIYIYIVEYVSIAILYSIYIYIILYVHILCKYESNMLGFRENESEKMSAPGQPSEAAKAEVEAQT